jgi:hypothetical protein
MGRCRWCAKFALERLRVGLACFKCDIWSFWDSFMFLFMFLMFLYCFFIVFYISFMNGLGWDCGPGCMWSGALLCGATAE